MRARTVSLYTREHSTRKLKPYNRRLTYSLDTIWVLRYAGRFETLGMGLTHEEAQIKREVREAGLRSGTLQPEPSKPRPVTKDSRLMLDAAIDVYLSNIEKGRKKKTFQAYSVALKYFYASCKNKPLADVNRTDLLNFRVFLQEEKMQSVRSEYNKFESVCTFLKQAGIRDLKITKCDWPQVVEEEPEIYEQADLDRFFSACTDDERLWFEFFLMTGMREQEVIFAQTNCFSLVNHTVSVKHNVAYKWTPKAYRERTIDVPLSLVMKLKAMVEARGTKGGLLFPTSSGKPKLDFYDCAQRVAVRAGMDPDTVWLHRFRSTFCTRSLWAGVDWRTVQNWMGHKDPQSTLRYAKPMRGAAAQAKVEGIWAVAQAQPEVLTVQ